MKGFFSHFKSDGKSVSILQLIICVQKRLLWPSVCKSDLISFYLY